MIGKYGKTVHEHSGGSGPLADPLVAAWDAVARGQQATPPGSDPADTALLWNVRALESIPLPTDAFLADLEYRLTQLAPRPAAAMATATPATWDARLAPFPRRRIPSTQPASSRGFLSMRIAAAVLALLLVAGSLVLYLTHANSSEPHSIPAAVATPPAMETLAQMDLSGTLWDMPAPADWEQIEFSLFLVDPGATFSTDTPWYTSVDGPMLIVALSGDLIVQPAGPARVYRDGAAATESPAGTPVILGPSDAIAFSSRATATGSNPGSEPVRALYGIAGVYDDAMEGSLVDAHDVTRVDINYEAHMILPEEGASLSIARLHLAPLDTFVYEWEAGWRVLPMYMPLQINDLRIYDGAADSLSPGILADAHYASLDRLKYPDPGPHTIINIGDETVDLYFLIVAPLADSATPTP